MRIRLSYKIFGAFLLTSLTIVSLTIGTLRFFGYRIFADYVKKMEVEKLSDLVEMLTAEYETSGGWSRLQARPQLWRRMVRAAGRRRPGKGGVFPDYPHELDRQRTEPSDQDPPLPPPPPARDFFSPGHRIFLLDSRMHPVVGRPEVFDESMLREISVDGKAIGWLGIEKGEPRLSPLEVAFLQRQNKLFLLIGAGIFMLSAFVSFFLSRHLLAPIKQLADGTRALASREFATRIEARSGDELGQLAADFNTMAHTLEQYEEMRKQWISDISHELRTPLSILRGEIEAMQDGVRAVDGPALDSLYSEVLHLGKIVEDLHELSMADTGALQLDRKPLDPIQVLTDTLSLFHTRLEQAHVAVQEELKTDESIIVQGDANRLAQLYGNILENVLRYADAPGTLRIWQDLAEAEVILNFEDSGPGVPQEALSRLFDRLYRVDSARTRGKGGSGLGLAICRAIVEGHGGTISAANAASGGLRIQIHLPLTERRSTLKT